MINEIEVFRTNITDSNGADRLQKELYALYPSSKINFDLEDRDKILRIETSNIDANQIISLGLQLGVNIEVLEH